jgi:hypothetical protein
VKGRQIHYSVEERAFIQSVSQLPRNEAHQAFCQRFNREEISLQNFNALCKRNGWLTGRTGCFAKGQEPPNKGKPCPPGTGGRHPNARKTQFQRGERQGVAVRLYKPIGTERISKDGYLERKIHDGMPLQSRWRAVHLVEWEAKNGPLPAGYALKCLDGDRRNVDPSNWEAIPRGVLARLNGGRFRKTLSYDDAANELKPIVMAAAKLKHWVGELQRRRQARTSATRTPAPKPQRAKDAGGQG